MVLERIRGHWLAHRYRRLRLFVLIWVVVVGGIGFIWQTGSWLWDRSTNYQRIAARVTAIGEECEVRSRQRGNRRAHYSAAMPCAEAETRRAGMPADHSPAVLRFALVRYEYVSPADGRPYPGSFRPDLRRSDERNLRPGDQVQVYAHITQPALSQR